MAQQRRITGGGRGSTVTKLGDVVVKGAPVEQQRKTANAAAHAKTASKSAANAVTSLADEADHAAPLLGEQEKQEVLLAQQGSLDVMWLSPHDRNAVEGAMLAFEQADDADTQQRTLTELETVVEAANISAHRRRTQANDATALLEDLGAPRTPEGVRFARHLEEVAAGIVEMDPRAHEAHARIRHGEVQHRRTQQAALEAGGPLQRCTNLLEELQHQNRALYDASPERALRTMRETLDETIRQARGVRNAIADGDPESVRRTDILVEGAIGEMQRFGRTLDNVNADFRRRGRVDADAYTMLNRKLAEVADLLGGARREVRSLAES